MTGNPSLLGVLQAVAGRPGTTKTAQIKFRAPDYLRALIEEAGERQGWGASEEIRRRLEHSFLAENRAGNNETYRLLGAIETVARNTEAPFGHWFENRFAFDTFRAAVLALVDLHRPPGVPIRPSDNGIADMFLGDDGTPETAGRMIAGGAAVGAGIPMPGGPKPTPNEGR
jgi:hypothetical protein